MVDLSTPALLREKQEKLFAVLRGLDRLIVAYSGGADSAYLVWAAHQVLGDRTLAITADSASMPESHKRDAEQFVHGHAKGLRHFRQHFAAWGFAPSFPKRDVRLVHANLVSQLLLSQARSFAQGHEFFPVIGTRSL